MTITPEKLRELADRAYEACLNPYADALMSAADEIERLTKKDDHLNLPLDQYRSGYEP